MKREVADIMDIRKKLESCEEAEHVLSGIRMVGSGSRTDA